MTDTTMAQESVLGSMLIDARCVHKVLEQLGPEDCQGTTAREVFEAVQMLSVRGQRIDPVTVLNQMEQPDSSTKDYLLHLMDLTPTAANVGEYVKIVREQSQLRQIQKLGARLIAADATLERAGAVAEELKDVLERRKSVACLSMEEGVLDFYENIEKQPDYLTWGIPMLDDPDAGLAVEAGDYVVLGGYPSDGKTALALTMALRQAKTKRVGFFSFETSSRKLFRRIYGQAARVSGRRIQHRNLGDEDWTKLEQCSDELKDRKLDLIEASGMSLHAIGTYAAARHYDVIYIDYLTLVPVKGRSDYEQATAVSKGLHRLAQEQHITVVALSQLSRPEPGRIEPGLSALRSSGQIEQDADVVMFLYRENRNNVCASRILKVAKNKEGPVGRVELDFDGDTMTFRQPLPVGYHEAKGIQVPFDNH